MKDTMSESDPIIGDEAFHIAMDEYEAEYQEKMRKKERRPNTGATLGDLLDELDDKRETFESRMNLKSGRDFFREKPPPMQWLVEGVVEKGALVMLAGPPKTAKSWFTLELGLSVASGKSLFGDPLLSGNGEPGTVLFCFLEDGPYNIHARASALASVKGIKDVGSLDTFFRFGGGIDMGQRSHAMAFADAIKRGVPEMSLICFDPFRNLHYGDENDSAAIIQVMDNLRLIRDVTGSAVLVVHHTRKPSASDKANPGYAIRGSGAIFGAVDGLISMMSVDNSERDTDSIVNNIYVRVKGGREASPFSASLTIKDGFDGRASKAMWEVSGRI